MGLYPSLRIRTLGRSSPPERGSLATSTYFVLFDAGFGAGSYTLGMLAAASSYGTMYGAAGAVIACSAALYYVLHHRRQRTVGEAACFISDCRDIPFQLLIQPV